MRAFVIWLALACVALAQWVDERPAYVGITEQVPFRWGTLIHVNNHEDRLFAICVTHYGLGVGNTLSFPNGDRATVVETYVLGWGPNNNPNEEDVCLVRLDPIGAFSTEGVGVHWQQPAEMDNEAFVLCDGVHVKDNTLSARGDIYADQQAYGAFMPWSTASATGMRFFGPAHQMRGGNSGAPQFFQGKLLGPASAYFFFSRAYGDATYPGWFPDTLPPLFTPPDASGNIDGFILNTVWQVWENYPERWPEFAAGCEFEDQPLAELLQFSRVNYPALYRQALILRRAGATPDQVREWLVETLCISEHE